MSPDEIVRLVTEINGNIYDTIQLQVQPIQKRWYKENLKNNLSKINNFKADLVFRIKRQSVDNLSDTDAHQ